MSASGYIGSLPAARWAEMKTGSVPDSLRANVEWMKHAQSIMRLEDPVSSVMEHDRQIRASTGVRGPTTDWDATDFARMRNEYAFAWNWSLAGCPIFTLTHSTAALLSATRAPEVDFDHSPFPVFLISVPDQFLPLASERPRPTRWIGVQSGKQMGEGPWYRPNSGSIMAIPDSDTLANLVAVGGAETLTEDRFLGKHGDDEEWKRILGVAVRLTSNVIQYVSKYRESNSVRRTSAASAAPLFELHPPEGVVVDRAFRDLVSDLVRARDFKGARRALSHIVRGHWRNQAVGSGRSERRLTWIQPFRRGDEAFGTVIQRAMRIGKDS
jgi:hypothetical protein